MNHGSFDLVRDLTPVPLIQGHSGPTVVDSVLYSLQKKTRQQQDERGSAKPEAGGRQEAGIPPGHGLAGHFAKGLGAVRRARAGRARGQADRRLPPVHGGVQVLEEAEQSDAGAERREERRYYLSINCTLMTFA